MANATNTLENNILTHLLRTGSWTKPTNLYLALFTTAPSDTALGTEVSASGTAYARLNVSPADATWSAPTDASGAQQSSNVNQLEFTEASTSWGTVSHGALMDISTGGSASNMLLHFAWTAPKTIAGGDQLVIKANQLKISCA
ncbi:MAG: hypothetical protein EOP06_00540 [Proteobacteria bacterium]|nr:MAG: hypothetical protein EOP06_00540 [Pseudomonadota bacterium]